MGRKLLSHVGKCPRVVRWDKEVKIGTEAPEGKK
jgi:hypothetical protein